MRLRMILADRSPALWSQFWSQLELPRPRFNAISRSSPPIRQARTSRVVRRRSLFDGTIKRPFDATFLDEEAVGSNPATPTIQVNEHGAFTGATVEAPIVWLAVG
jgi:hypothetical protein